MEYGLDILTKNAMMLRHFSYMHYDNSKLINGTSWYTLAIIRQYVRI